MEGQELKGFKKKVESHTFFGSFVRFTRAEPSIVPLHSKAPSLTSPCHFFAEEFCQLWFYTNICVHTAFPDIDQKTHQTSEIEAEKTGNGARLRVCSGGLTLRKRSWVGS
jgi:hypothetical protein